MRKLGVKEWLVKAIQAMYKHPRSSVRVNRQYSVEFPVGVRMHQGSVLSPLLFVIVMEALSQEFRASCPWELYVIDLVIIAKSLWCICYYIHSLASHGHVYVIGLCGVMLHASGTCLITEDIATAMRNDNSLIGWIT